ncbi:hypothetical protein [Streptomyces calidiresistens]|uniref:Uncharacterized protein n=1 Tax=Streptomyces calidiresistens TaxID=1485586 RepID=A0A7W3XX95_9ACTN|nr:hypothetical protein [Streptomyces calidiresistens]MBB0230678.1 hypothetical protein [Streptomyces calidiresistens]
MSSAAPTGDEQGHVLGDRRRQDVPPVLLVPPGAPHPDVRIAVLVTDDPGHPQAGPRGTGAALLRHRRTHRVRGVREAGGPQRRLAIALGR